MLWWIFPVNFLRSIIFSLSLSLFWISYWQSSGLVCLKVFACHMPWPVNYNHFCGVFLLVEVSGFVLIQIVFLEINSASKRFIRIPISTLPCWLTAHIEMWYVIWRRRQKKTNKFYNFNWIQLDFFGKFDSNGLSRIVRASNLICR